MTQRCPPCTRGIDRRPQKARSKWLNDCIDANRFDPPAGPGSATTEGHGNQQRACALPMPHAVKERPPSLVDTAPQCVPAIDLSVLEALIGTDEGAIREVIALYADSIRSISPALRSGVVARDAMRVQAAAHGINHRRFR